MRVNYFPSLGERLAMAMDHSTSGKENANGSGNTSSFERETEALRARYKKRAQAEVARRYPPFSPFQHFSRCEREFWFGRWLVQRFSDLDAISVLEIGAGYGDNLGFFRRLGIPPQNIWANELLPERIEKLANWASPERILAGDALKIQMDSAFDVVLQSTVFSSILDSDFRKALARKMWQSLKPGGAILWYDFTVNNPRNHDVAGIPVSEVESYFPDAREFIKRRVTLAPPIARRVGRIYNFVNVPILRTHICVLVGKGM